MPTPQQNQDGGLLHASIQELGRKIDELIASLPNTYVTIRAHDRAIEAHESRIAELERWRNESTKQQNEEHNDLRKEWRGELQQANTKLDSVETTITRLDERFKALNKTLIWLLGVITTIFSSVAVSIIILYLTHVIHF